MKTIGNIKRFAPILLVAIVGLIFSMLVGAVAAAGATLAMAAQVAGETVSTEKVDGESPELNLDTILPQITEISPGRAPLDTLIRRVGRAAKARNWKVDEYEIVERPFVDTVATAYTTVLGVKSAEVEVTNISQWTNDHTVMDQASGNVYLVTAVDYATNKITISSLDEGSGAEDVPTIGQNTKLTRMGPALSELQADTDAFAEVPTKDYNYCQKFAAKISQSFVQQITEQEVKWTFSDIQRMRIKKMREEIEMSYWAGVRAKTLRQRNSKQEYVYTMGGISRFAGKSLEYGLGGTDRTLNDDTMSGLMKDIFTGNAGNEKRFGFYGSSFGKYLYGITDWTKYIKANDVEVTPGLTFNKYKHNYGELYMIYHPLFDQMGWDERMAVVDLDFLVKADMFKLKITDLLLEETGTEDSNAKVIKETSSLLTLYPEVHAIIDPKA